MHLAYLPQLLARNVISPIAMPCWITSPLHLIRQEPRILLIEVPKELPEQVGIAILNELAVFDRVHTIFYSLCENSVEIINKLMTQLQEVETLAHGDNSFAKEILRFANPEKALEKAPLYIIEKRVGIEQLCHDIHSLMAHEDFSKKRLKVIIISDLLSLSDFKNATDRRAIAQNALLSLKQMLSQHKISFVVMSNAPLHDLFPAKQIQKAFATINKNEYPLETILI